MKELKRLISVKKIIALLLTLTFVILTLRQIPVDEPFKTIFIMIVSFYFGQSTAKGAKEV